MSELFSIGDKVRINTEPGCPGEFTYHGIRPYTKGLEGTVVKVEPDNRWQHYYEVRFSLPIATGLDDPKTVQHGAFMPGELEVVTV